MLTVTDPYALQADLLARRARGQKIGFVPTMGFLHEGHCSLFRQARVEADCLVASIYVNPLQFGPNEDLSRYPRDPEGDAEKCRTNGVDVLFMPPNLYDPDHATEVAVSGLTGALCGASRPTHFAGVTTVVARLFGFVQPHFAIFGEKDFQQLAVIRRMTRDLAMPIQIRGGALVRDADGVALSSRNAYLSADQRERARSLHRALHEVREAFLAGERDRAKLEAIGAAAVQADRLDYLEVREELGLGQEERVEAPSRVFVAAFFGKTRLIDNLALRA